MNRRVIIACVSMSILLCGVLCSCGSSDELIPLKTSDELTPLESSDKLTSSGGSEASGEKVPLDLPAGLDDDVVAALTNAYETSYDDDLGSIISHADDFALDGPEVQRKLLLLAANEPAARSQIKEFPTAYPQSAGLPYTEPVTKGSFPHLYQWDARWGNFIYSSTAFSCTGCCPTAFSIVYMGLTGKTDLTPYDFALRARNGGYESQYQGTDGSFIEAEAEQLGFTCSNISVDTETLKEYLGAGYVVICNPGYGTFSSYGGHYIVITGINGDGTVTINDPYSKVRSDKSWDADEIIGQTKALYALKA